MKSNVERIGVEENFNGIPMEYIPKPAGWQLLVNPFKKENLSTGGIILTEDIQNANKHLNMVGQVVAMGDLCYTDERFSVGQRDAKSWCKVGDWIIYGQNLGNRFTIYDEENNPVEFILLNDDNVKGVVEDPRNIRAYV